jgi:hypothetical protein
MRKSCFNEKHHLLAMTAARHLARLTMKSKTCLYSQWIQGDYNGVSDMLSRDSHLTDAELTSLISLSCPE